MEAKTLKRKRKPFIKELKTEASIIRLRIQEIDRELDVVMGLGVVQKKWRLDKLKREYERKLKKTVNSP